MALPPLRYIDAFPVDEAGQRYICLRDPEGIVEHQIVLTPAAFFVASRLDGEADVRAIQRAFAQQFNGQEASSEDILRIVNELDEQGFLLSERFEARRQHVETAFSASARRPAYLAGKSYADQAGALRTFLDEQFTTRAGGPGEAPGASPGSGDPLRCLIAPHIDFHRGGHAYARAYLKLFQQGQPDVVIIFGVAHISPPAPFVLTRKAFDTPFGALTTDQDLVRHLEAACSWDPYAYEMAHRTEHSIEFQAVMLSYLYGPNVRIVPILCSTFGSELGGIEPAKIAGVKAFLETCQDVVAAMGKRISVIAGADLAHVGRRFGDSFDISEPIVEGVAERDREDLQYVTAGDADGFYRSVMQDRNERRICGLNCIYASLKTVARSGSTGELLHYDYAHDPAGGIVSFADVAFA
jgi:AmmeMemoRadiSam system protein B